MATNRQTGTTPRGGDAAPGEQTAREGRAGAGRPDDGSGLDAPEATSPSTREAGSTAGTGGGVAAGTGRVGGGPALSQPGDFTSGGGATGTAGGATPANFGAGPAGTSGATSGTGIGDVQSAEGNVGGTVRAGDGLVDREDRAGRDETAE